jgi:hypothetical protein
MDRKRFISLLGLVLAFNAIIHTKAYTQDSIKRVKTSGGLIGLGNAITKQTNYKVLYFAGDWSWSFNKPKRKDFAAWYLEPQFNLVHTLRPWDFEFGTNLGFRNYIKVNPGFYLYQMLGSGPHYISARLDRQATGFIFSDNLAIGAFTRFNKKGLFLNLQFRIRHISNANLRLPNRGVNSVNFLLGLSRFR